MYLQAGEVITFNHHCTSTKKLGQSHLGHALLQMGREIYIGYMGIGLHKQ